VPVIDGTEAAGIVAASRVGHDMLEAFRAALWTTKTRDLSRSSAWSYTPSPNHLSSCSRPRRNTYSNILYRLVQDL
jgi:hypothetical protein